MILKAKKNTDVMLNMQGNVKSKCERSGQLDIEREKLVSLRDDLTFDVTMNSYSDEDTKLKMDLINKYQRLIHKIDRTQANPNRNDIMLLQIELRKFRDEQKNYKSI